VKLINKENLLNELISIRDLKKVNLYSLWIVSVEKYVIHRINTKSKIIWCRNNLFGYKTEFSGNCYFGDGFVSGYQGSITNSIIGSKCRIGDNVKIIECLILDQVLIENLVCLQKSIIGKDCKITEKCNLSKCIILPYATVRTKTLF